ncbi:TPA: hypothetical protein ACGG8A_003573 [Vibrio cholerae]|uniref:hypothetical protein n=1 Tax=Vibrio vulnificus TaxID=672 RepID=UPI001594D92D|nr:hypothetical protein [Vibrio vulnificus]MBN8090958.1 hypothetical protein [Vibrio vulnificus]MBN8119805.1 hypothetical protein [Vibrio vulnificus]MCU8391443.1 hypothetical protein [Vibrio vulnificus]NVC74046.1 hypothetical protein [Vibrio vulnificus]HAS6240105.1 hypothetical protein [Vibrio vulnificus]
MEELPQNKDLKDHAHSGVKAALNLIPFAGGALASVFETVFSAPIDKRKEEWLILLASTVEEICEKVEELTPETLSENETFISAYLQASNLALRTHQAEKIAALNSAVKNTVLLEDLDETLKMIFIRFIDDMTPLHFRVLHFLSNPNEYINKLMTDESATVTGDLQDVWNELYTDVSTNDPLIDLVISDLYNLGLLTAKTFRDARLGSVSTPLGLQFIEFIEYES